MAYAKLSLLVLAMPLAVSLFVEPLLLIWAARQDRERVIARALGVQALALVGAACAPNAWTFLCGVSVATLMISLVCALAQARLIEAHPDRPEQILVRWTFMGALGDIAAPLLFAGLQRFHGGFRGAFIACAAFCLAQGWLLRRNAQHGPPRALELTAEAVEPRLYSQLMAAGRAALSNRALAGWALATMGCALLDEIFLVFAALHLRERGRFDAATTDLLLFALALGSVLGIALSDRLIARLAPRWLLTISCSICIAVYSAWLHMDGALANGACLFVIGAAVGPQFPIAQAQCYRCAGKQPLLVNLLETMLEPLHAALPWLIGWLADRFGLDCALGVLLVQPVLLLCALLVRMPRALV